MILHVYANRSNVGDWLSALGIRSLLPPDEPVEELLCDTPFVSGTLERLAAAGPDDVVVIGGGGLFMDYFAPFWEGLAALDLAAPLVVWGAGAVDLKAEPSRLDARVVRPLLARAPVVAVRDDLTRDHLGLPGAIVALCPSALAVPAPAGPGAGVLHVANYTTAGPAAYEAMRAAGRAFATATGRPFRETNNRIESGDRRGLAATVDLYAASDVVLSSRLHGCILALANSRALVAVSGDRKVEAFLEAVGLGATAIDAADVDLVPAALERAAAAGPPALDLAERVARDNAPVAAAVSALLAARARSGAVRRPATAPEAAARAWSAVPGSRPPARIEPLGERTRHPRSRSALHRLVAAGPDGETVVAKGGPASAVRLEEAIHAEILPALAPSWVRCYGAVEDGPDASWLFLEEVAGRSWDPADPRDRRLAGAWLGTVHARAAAVAPPAVPALDLDTYREKLTDARARFAAARARGAPADRERVARILARLDALDRAWPAVAERWDAAPRSLVHGDFIAKNVIVRATPAGEALAVLDWERAGWGVPAEDLADVDLDAYVAAGRAAGGDVDPRGARALRDLGAVLQAIAFVQSWSVGLEFEPLDGTLAALETWSDALERARDRAGIGGPGPWSG